MSTRERLYNIIDSLDEQQMQELIDFLNSRKRGGKPAASVKGILSRYANPDLIPLEENAWERAAKQNYENT